MQASILEKICAAVSWYATIDRDYADIVKLMEARRRLACHIFAFAMEVGELNREKSRKEHLRKSKYARTVSEQLEKSEGKNVAAAKEHADFKTQFERGEETASESEYYAARVVYEAANNVLDCLNQHISNLKQERRLEYTGQGSQQT
jgi:hypothetical protein